MRRLITTLFFFVFSACAQAEDPSEIWMEGYLYLQKALTTEENGEKSAAIHLLIRSLDCYRILARKHAHFEGERRDERILLIADKLESVGVSPLMSYLRSSGSKSSLLESAARMDLTDFGSLNESNSLSANRIIRATSGLNRDLLKKLLSTAIPQNWALGNNQTGTQLTIPLIETDETRHYGALVRSIESMSARGYSYLDLVQRDESP